ncbi:unnamed protein product, partial [Trichogramma brassicae]
MLEKQPANKRYVKKVNIVEYDTDNYNDEPGQKMSPFKKWTEETIDTETGDTKKISVKRLVDPPGEIEIHDDSKTKPRRYFERDAVGRVESKGRGSIGPEGTQAAQTTATGIAEGEYVTLGRVTVDLNGSPIILHVIPNSVPIDVSGLIGWDVIEKYNGIVNAAERTLILNDDIFPFIGEDKIELPPRSRKIIKTHALNDERVGLVPLQHLADGEMTQNDEMIAIVILKMSQTNPKKIRRRIEQVIRRRIRRRIRRNFEEESEEEFEDDEDEIIYLTV